MTATAEPTAEPESEVTDEQIADLAAQLRKLLEDHAQPDPSVVSLLPKGKGRDGSKPEGCDTCGGWHKPGMFHLDYVGHADVTRILIQTDPFWDWEPYAHDANGLPLMDRDGSGNPTGMWIKLTVLGRTVKGYGNVEPGKHDAVKELIGDAIRNAGMRLGIALNLWSKADRTTAQRVGDMPDPTPQSNGGQRGRQQGQQTRSAPPAGRDTPPPAGDGSGDPETDKRRTAAKRFAVAVQGLARLGDNGTPQLGNIKDKAGALGFPEDSIKAWMADPGDRDAIRELTQHFATFDLDSVVELGEFAANEEVPF